MIAVLTLAICAVLARPLHRLMDKTLPRRHGTLRPRLVWLTIGLSCLVIFALFGLILSQTPVIALIRACAFGSGVGSIAYFAHRRVHFRTYGAYEYRFGMPTRVCLYRDAIRCEAGEDIIREGLLLRLKTGAAWGVPGMMPLYQIEEALLRVCQSGLPIPTDTELKSRLGLSRPYA